jgi:hypothetical protein
MVIAALTAVAITNMLDPYAAGCRIELHGDLADEAIAAAAAPE